MHFDWDIPLFYRVFAHFGWDTALSRTSPGTPAVPAGLPVEVGLRAAYPPKWAKSTIKHRYLPVKMDENTVITVSGPLGLIMGSSEESKVGLGCFARVLHSRNCAGTPDACQCKHWQAYGLTRTIGVGVPVAVNHASHYCSPLLGDVPPLKGRNLAQLPLKGDLAQ